MADSSTCPYSSTENKLKFISLEDSSTCPSSSTENKLKFISPTCPSSSTANKFINLRSSDGEIFEVEEAVAFQSQTIKNLIEDTSANVVPLENVSSQILTKVITYCKKHTQDEDLSTNEKHIWDTKFLQVDLSTIFELCLAANYLDIKNLLDLVLQYIADYIKDKSVEELREIFGIENDFTPEEEAKIRKENQWAFE